jgi:hypothetical protein
MVSMLLVAALTIATGPVQPSPMSDARHVSLDTPHAILQIDTGKMKGEPWRLAWSPDGSQLYVETVDREAGGTVRATRGALITVATRTVNAVDRAPEWVGQYWRWKSAQASPAEMSFKIAVDQRQETVRSTATPTGGALAKGGSADPNAGSTIGDANTAANNAQRQTIVDLKVKNELIGEWINEAVGPGENFSWAPAPNRLLTYAKRGGGPLIVLDDRAQKQSLAGTKDAVLPAWSDSGAQLAWLEKKDKKHYELMIGAISMK